MFRVIMNVVWGSFLVAILAEGIFFSVFDPQDLQQLMGSQELSSISFYTIAFFFFCAIGFLASALTHYLTNATD